MQIHLAADATIGAGGTDMARFPRANLVKALLFHECGHRAGLDALAAEYALRTL